MMRIIEEAMKPMDPGIEMPKRNRFDMLLGVFTTHGFPQTGYDCYNDRHYCKLLVEEIAEFDFYNEFEGFLEHNNMKAKPINWSSSWLNIIVGDRIVDLDTMKLYKVYGFNGEHSQIYFDVE